MLPKLTLQKLPLLVAPRQLYLTSTICTTVLSACFHTSSIVEWRTKQLLTLDQERKMAENVEGNDYSHWSHDSLVKRITCLERQLKGRTATYVSRWAICTLIAD